MLTDRGSGDGASPTERSILIGYYKGLAPALIPIRWWHIHCFAP